MSSDKIDAWVAWHPEQGPAIFTTNEHGEFACWVALMDSFDEPFVNDEDVENFKRSDDAKGWRIRPVRLDFLDEVAP